MSMRRRAGKGAAPARWPRYRLENVPTEGTCRQRDAGGIDSAAARPSDTAMVIAGAGKAGQFDEGFARLASGQVT